MSSMVIKYPQVGDKASLAYMAVDLGAKLARRGKWGCWRGDCWILVKRNCLPDVNLS
jgi:hypothetical protein